MKKKNDKKQIKYEKPMLKEAEGMTFTKQVWKSFGGTGSCMQCGGCHGCR